MCMFLATALLVLKRTLAAIFHSHQNDLGEDCFWYAKNFEQSILVDTSKATSPE